MDLKRLAMALSLLLGPMLCSCYSSVPKAIARPPSTPISVIEVQRDAPRFLGQQVRWGGSILAVHERAHDQMFEIELLAQPLVAQSGEPKGGGATAEGRFLTEIPGPVDRYDCRKGRRLTVSGRLLWVEPRPLGQGSYTYPVVVADAWHLWPEPASQSREQAPAYEDGVWRVSPGDDTWPRP